jgi:hypothetical protein
MENVITKQVGVTAAVYGYETAALLSDGRLPTISALCDRYPWLSAIAITALVVHLRKPVLVMIVPLRSRGSEFGPG